MLYTTISDRYAVGALNVHSPLCSAGINLFGQGSLVKVSSGLRNAHAYRAERDF